MLEVLCRLFHRDTDWYVVDIVFTDQRLIDGSPAGSGPVMQRIVAGKTEYRRMTEAEMKAYQDEIAW